MNRNVCLHTTHNWVNLTPYPTQDRWPSSPGDPDHIREHLVLLCFPSATAETRSVRLTIVTDHEPDEEDVWRQPSTRKKHTISQDHPEAMITLLLSKRFDNKPVPLPLSFSPTSSEKRLRILHDGTHLLDPSTSRLEFFFECLGSYVTPLGSEHDYHGYHDLRPLTTSIHIFSIDATTRTRALPPLSAESIVKIGEELISEEPTLVACARLLTSCSLVCKAWYNSGVHDLLWPCFVEKSGTLYMPDNRFEKLVRCVERYSWIGERILMLPCPIFDEYSVKALEDLCGALIKKTPNIKHLNLVTSQWNVAWTYLSSLQHVESAKLIRDGRRGFPDKWEPQRLNICDIMQVINGWTLLKELWVKQWEVDSDVRLPQKPAAYELQVLLMDGYDHHSDSLSLEILKHLLSRPSSLQVLSISHTNGLSEDDLKTIFVLIKSTIVELTIENCMIHFDSNSSSVRGGKDESIFGSVVGEMPRLRSVTFNQLEIGLTSSSGILNKKPSEIGLTGRYECWWQQTPNNRIDDLENALRWTGWKEITLLAVWDSTIGYSTAKKVAKDRGIILKVKFS